MQNRRVKRARGILAIILSICICFIYYLTSQSGIVFGANTKVDERRVALERQREKNETLEGSFVDRDGEYITVSQEKGEAAQIIMPEIYSHLIGYNSNIYGTSALRNRYAELLYQGGKDDIGATIKLTTDNEMQQLCYSLIGEDVGSIVVLDNKTGEILAMTSRGSKTIEYNANLIDDHFKEYSEIDKFFYNRALLAEDPAGSTFKIVTSAALLEEEKGNYIYNDQGEYKNIHNAGKAIYGEVALETALIKSVNTYFAAAGNMLGGVVLENIAKQFMLGEEAIELDFGVLTSNFDLDYYKSEIVAATAYGQGKTMISPLHIAMILSSVLNNGEMLKPYLIKNIQDDGVIVYAEKNETLCQTISKSSAKELKKYLHKVAVTYGFDEKTYGKVYAKTGTAQLGKSYNHIYLVFATDSYTGIISKDCSNESSRTLVKPAKEILNYLTTQEDVHE